ncbi:MAG: hypothetical protein ACYDCL_08140 [Myxococcales bacterium]
MLDAFIIEELKRREREGQREGERPQPSPPPGHGERGPARQSDHSGDEEKPQRGVVIIDYSV